MNAATRAHWLLLCGAGVGVALAAAGVLRAGSDGGAPGPMAVPPREAVPADSAATVNGRPISRADFEQVLAQEVAGGVIANPAEKRRLLDRMVDEELRVQRAIELNLHLTDARVRMDLASAVAEAATARVEEAVPNETTLRAYFEERRQFFAQRGAVRVRRIWVGIISGNLGEASARARAATKLLREKEAFDTVLAIAGSADPRPLPDRLLAPVDLLSYVGRTALNVVLTLNAGQVSDPIRATDGFQVLLVVERRGHGSVTFDACRLDVEAEYWAARTGEALAANAAELRRSASIRLAETF